MPSYTLDELIELMKPDQALIRQCINGLIEYAAELRQCAGAEGMAGTAKVRDLIARLEGYWGLDDGSVDYLNIFDSQMAKVDRTARPRNPTEAEKRNAILGLKRYALEMVSAQGMEALGQIQECVGLMREIADFWGFGSQGGFARQCMEIEAMLAEQAAKESAFEMGGLQ